MAAYEAKDTIEWVTELEEDQDTKEIHAQVKVWHALHSLRLDPVLTKKMAEAGEVASANSSDLMLLNRMLMAEWPLTYDV